MFTMYASPDSGFSNPLSLPSCSTFDPLSSPTSASRFRRRLSFESINFPPTREAATQTEPQLTAADIARCRRAGRKLREMCDEFDAAFFQPAQSNSKSESSSYPSFSSLL
ncbi:hypothetical protein PMAYCL1PPCAC_32254, partial [Pristionchus mayeri]